ncbi:MAG: iron-containing alcohol dehydrogenase [Clostridia bacterium]|nr:iron-containing alcohol dehydrogenase [Clostridia bacterium]
MKDFDVRTIGGTLVVTGQDVCSVIPKKIEEVSKEGAICIVYDKKLRDIALAVADALKPTGRRLFLRVLDKAINDALDLPDFVRYVIAVGSGFAAHSTRVIANKLNVGWSMFLTAPSTDTVLQGKSPNHVFIDENVMINCPKECVAAGYGILCSQGLHAFENLFSKWILATSVDDEIYSAIDEIDPSPTKIALALLEISAAKTHEDSADVMASILYQKLKSEGRKTRLLGEYKLVASSSLCSLYSSILASPAIDTLPPADVCADNSALEDIGIDVSKHSKRFDFFDINGYFRISYILSEYRMELLDKIGGAHSHSLERTWRRIYDDAGFWLKSELSANDVMTAMRLAGVLSDNLLGYAYAVGMLR